VTADELALLRHIEAYPDDDLPRLVYADWLDEQGRHTRAEFIRVQCELATIERLLPTMTKDERRVQGPRRGKLQHVVKALLRADPVESLGLPPIGWQEDISNWWDWGDRLAAGCVRGFISHVQLSTYITEFSAALRFCKQFSPIPFVAVEHEEATSTYPEWRAAFQFQELWSHVGEFRLFFQDEAMNALMALPDELIPMTEPEYPSLRYFRADNCELSSEHLRVLCERLKAPRLESVNFSHNEITDSGVEYLGSARFAVTVRSIDLSYNPLPRPNITTLVRQNFPVLEGNRSRGQTLEIRGVFRARDRIAVSF
jgi:uncharacterized protein (TIGR02996 family)